MFTLYKITCSVSGKIYIGYTKLTANQRLHKHFSEARRNVNSRHLCKAIRKYGEEAFTTETLFEVPTEQEAKELEKKLIVEYDSFKNGYNKTTGGDGVSGVTWQVSPEQRKLFGLRSKMKCYIPNTNEDARNRMSEAKLDNHVSAMSVTIDGVEYTSLRDAERKLGVSLYRIKKYVETGEWSDKEHSVSKKPYYAEGIWFETRQHAADHYGVGINNLSNFLKRREHYNKRLEGCEDGYFNATEYLKYLKSDLKPAHFLDNTKVLDRLKHSPIITRGRNAYTQIHMEDKELFDSWILMNTKPIKEKL